MLRAVRVELGSTSLLLALACVALASVGAEQWSLQRDALASGEWWRLWSAHLVHYSTRHALLDAAAVALCGHVAERQCGRLFVAAVLSIAAPAVSLYCLAGTAMDEYRGASSLAVLLGVLAGGALWQARPAQRAWLAALGGAWFAKTFVDIGAMPFTPTDLPAEVRVAWPAHLAGAACGGVAWWMRRAARFSRLRFPACDSIRDTAGAPDASDGRSVRSADAI